MPWLVIVILHAPQSQNLSTCFLAPAKLPDVMRIHSFFCSHSVYLSALCQYLLHTVHCSFPLDNVDPILPCFWDFLHPQNLLIRCQIILKYFQKHLSTIDDVLTSIIQNQFVKNAIDMLTLMVSGQGSAQVPPPCILTEANLALTRISSPWWRILWKITRLYSKNPRSGCTS